MMRTNHRWPWRTDLSCYVTAQYMKIPWCKQVVTKTVLHQVFNMAICASGRQPVTDLSPTSLPVAGLLCYSKGSFRSAYLGVLVFCKVISMSPWSFSSSASLRYSTFIASYSLGLQFLLIISYVFFLSHYKLNGTTNWSTYSESLFLSDQNSRYWSSVLVRQYIMFPKRTNVCFEDISYRKRTLIFVGRNLCFAHISSPDIHYFTWS